MDGSVPQQRMSLGHFSVAQLTSVVERSHARLCAVLVLLSLVCFLPGFASLQPMDRDEPRYAQASKQMLETGDFVDIRFQDEARHKKPVGIYWMQSASVALGDALGVPEARTTIALYRIPSLFGAIATVLLTYWAALAFFGRRGAFLTAALMATCVILMVEARLAKTDAMLTACSVAVMGGLARAYLSRGAGVLPWFVAIAIKSGGEFFAASVGKDMLGKVGTAQKYHWAPPGFYLLSFFATFWPGAILAAIAVPFAWIHRREEPVVFALAWIVPSWLVFELVPTKLPHYTMPLFPAGGVVTGMAIFPPFFGAHPPPP